MKRVVMFSAGGGSWGGGAACRGGARDGEPDPSFTDTMMEDADAYRFLVQGAADVFGIDLPSQMVPAPYQFRTGPIGLPTSSSSTGCGVEFEGAIRSRVDRPRRRHLGCVPAGAVLGQFICGPVLQDPEETDGRLAQTCCDPAATTVYVGIDKFEEHRFDDGEGGGVPGPRGQRQAGWRYEAPLLEPPYLAPWDVHPMRGVASNRPSSMGEAILTTIAAGSASKPVMPSGVNCCAMHLTALTLPRVKRLLREMLGDVSILTDRKRRRRGKTAAR